MVFGMKGRKIVLVVGIIGLLVISSLSIAVSEQTVNISDKIVSPLFAVRTQRAIKNQNCKEITINNLGEGEKAGIYIPSLRNRLIPYRNIINKIESMSDEDYDNFVNSLIKKGLDSNIIHESQIKNLKGMFYNLKDNPKILSIANHHDNAKSQTYPNCVSSDWCRPTIGGGCLFFLFIILTLLLLFS